MSTESPLIGGRNANIVFGFSDHKIIRPSDHFVSRAAIKGGMAGFPKSHITFTFHISKSQHIESPLIGGGNANIVFGPALV